MIWGACFGPFDARRLGNYSFTTMICLCGSRILGEKYEDRNVLILNFIWFLF